MTNLLNVKTDVFDAEAVIVEVYKNSQKVAKTFIKPFMPEMKKANNIILFIDNDYNVTGGQIGLYDLHIGLRVEMF